MSNFVRMLKASVIVFTTNVKCPLARQWEKLILTLPVTLTLALALNPNLGLGVGLGLILPTAEPNEPARLVHG